MADDFLKYLEGKTKEDFDRLKKTIDEHPEIKKSFDEEIEKNPELKSQYPSFDDFVLKNLPQPELTKPPAKEDSAEDKEKKEGK